MTIAPSYVWIISHLNEERYSTIAAACRTKEGVIRELRIIMEERRELFEGEIVEARPTLEVENVQCFGSFLIDDSIYEIDFVQVLN